MPTSSTSYMLLFRDTAPDQYRSLSPQERQELLTRWTAWYDRLAVAGKVTSGHPLDPKLRLISGARGERVIDGPFAESKEAIGGFFMLAVDSLDEATEIAQQCPSLPYGIKIEVRLVAESCHLAKPVDAPVRELIAH